jgi:hypothetical protein
MNFFTTKGESAVPTLAYVLLPFIAAIMRLCP